MRETTHEDIIVYLEVFMTYKMPLNIFFFLKWQNKSKRARSGTAEWSDHAGQVCPSHRLYLHISPQSLTTVPLQDSTIPLMVCVYVTHRLTTVNIKLSG